MNSIQTLIVRFGYLWSYEKYKIYLNLPPMSDDGRSGEVNASVDKKEVHEIHAIGRKRQVESFFLKAIINLVKYFLFLGDGLWDVTTEKSEI